MNSVKLNEEEKRLLHNAWHHFLTITHHKLVVMAGCFKVGLFKQGCFMICRSIPGRNLRPA